MAMEYSGVVVKVEATQRVSDTFTKRNIIICDDPTSKYPNYVSFEAHKDTCNKLDRFGTGQLVKVIFLVNGRRWVDKQGQEKFFTTLKLVDIHEQQKPAVEKKLEDMFF